MFIAETCQIQVKLINLNNKQPFKSILIQYVLSNLIEQVFIAFSGGMEVGLSRPSTGYEPGAPMVYGHSISGSSDASGGSTGMGGKPFSFKTTTRGGTTMQSAHRNFGVLG